MFCPRSLHSHQDPQSLPHPLQEVGATAQARPLAGVSLAEWLTQLQTHLSNEICTVTRLPASCGKGNLAYRFVNGLFVHRKQGLFLSVYVDDIKIDGKKQNMAPTWMTLMKLVDLGEPTSFLDHMYLGCTKRECKVNESIIDQCRENVRSTNFC